MNSQTDALILGGGPAGAATAVHLARAGRCIALVEQSITTHHKVCGDFLSREAVECLDRLGLDLRELGALPISSVRLAGHREIAACDLPFPAVSLTRRSLDEALLSLAAKSGAEIRRGCRVDSLSQTSSGFVAHLSNGKCLQAPTVFLGTGKQDIAGHRRPAGIQNELVAFKMYFQLTRAQQQALQGIVELYLFPGGYAGLQLVEDDWANLCLLITRATLRKCNNHWPAILDHLRDSSELLAQRLDSAMALLAKPLAVSSIPYGMMRKTLPPALWPLGDQAAVIPSFSGDGISIALHSAQLAGEYFIRGKSSAEFLRQMRDELRSSLRLATTLSRIMIAAPALAHVTRLWPVLLSKIASRTRIPAHSCEAAIKFART